jgi:CRP-like cAMP-binding protein
MRRVPELFSSTIPKISEEKILKRWRNVFLLLPRKTSDAGRILQALPFFASCSKGELHRLGLLFYERVYKAGELVCSQDTPGNALYVVREGSLERKSPALLGAAEEGCVAPALLSALESGETLGAGDFFGVEGLFVETRYKHNIAARTETTLLVLFRHDLEQFALRYPKTACRVLYAFSRFFAVQDAQGAHDGIAE